MKLHNILLNSEKSSLVLKKIVIAKSDFRNWRKIRFLNKSYKIHKI